MDVSGYVGRRIFFEYWDYSNVMEEKFEPIYKELEDYYRLFRDLASDFLSDLKIHKRNNSTDAVHDLKKVYIDMIKEVNDFNSLKNLRLMYIATRLFLDIYKEDPITSAHIVFSFQLMSYRSNCWDVMIKQYDQSNDRFCTLL